MRQSIFPTAVCAIIMLCGSTPLLAGVGDPTLRTSHPFYPGEGAFQTVDDCVAFATRGVTGEQQRAIAMYQWLLTHQFHLPSPMEWNVPGQAPGSRGDDYEMVVYDANRGRFSYGYGLCGTVHAWNEPYWRALGMSARRRSFPGHTNSEINYGGAWHAFDTDMAGLVFRADGVVAGYEDIIKNPSLVKLNDRKLPCYPFAWPGDFNGMKKGWAEVASGGTWYKMYNAGYEGMPGIVHLRRGETFTRYFDRDHFGGPSKRRFWHTQSGGPFRDWTFVNQGEPRHDGAKANARGNASYCNAEFVYEPDLTSDAWREGAADAPPNLVSQSSSPRLRGRDGKEAAVIFTHHSPYVIAGDPDDDANPMTKRATGGLVVSGKTVGDVVMAVSTNGGQSWTDLGGVSGAFEKDLTEHVKGRYGWWVRFMVRSDAGLDAVRFTTVCQTSQVIYPRLTPSGCEVTWRAASRAVAPATPDFGLTEDAVAAVEQTSQRSANLRYTPRSSKQRLAYTTTNNKPASVVFNVRAPGELVEVVAAARYQIRVPPPQGSDFHLDLSTDGGATWSRLAKSEIPEDNEYSSGWMWGRAAVAGKANAALVRATVYAGGYTTGLINAEMYGIYRTPPPQATTVTYAWREGGAVKTHTENIKPGATVHRFTVPTGGDITDEYVRITAP